MVGGRFRILEIFRSIDHTSPCLCTLRSIRRTAPSQSSTDVPPISIPLSTLPYARFGEGLLLSRLDAAATGIRKGKASFGTTRRTTSLSLCIAREGEAAAAGVPSKGLVGLLLAGLAALVEYTYEERPPPSPPSFRMPDTCSSAEKSKAG